MLSLAKQQPMREGREMAGENLGVFLVFARERTRALPPLQIQYPDRRSGPDRCAQHLLDLTDLDTAAITEPWIEESQWSDDRSEEHTSELQSRVDISYAV